MNTKTNREAKKLTLRRESLRELTQAELLQVAGASAACHRQTQAERPHWTAGGGSGGPCLFVSVGRY